MSTKGILAVFKSVRVLDDADFWGAGEWKFSASVDGEQVGNSSKLHEARANQTIDLGDDWSKRIDVSGKAAGDTVVIKFSGKEDDVFWDDDLGHVKITLQWPFKQDFDLILKASKVSGLFSSTRYYELSIAVYDVPEDIDDLEYEPAIVVSRGGDGSGNYTAFSMGQMQPRVEVCPVTPMPTRMPPRQVFPADFASGKATDASQPVILSPTSNLNALSNPAFIANLADNDPDLRKKAARLSVTYVEPHNVSRKWFYWHVKSGPVEFLEDDPTGKSEVFARGTNAPDDPDEIAVIELRWSAPDGPLLCTFRAWVGKVRTVHYRMNIINGLDPVNQPQFSPNVSPADVHRYMQIARVMYWQAGLDLQSDPDATRWDGAAATAHSGVFIVPGGSDAITNLVPITWNPDASRLNFNPGVLNVTFVRSHAQNRAYASDVQGVNGANQIDNDAPSASWVRPCGVPPDVPHGTVTMRTLSDHPRVNAGDGAYVTARKAVQPSFTAADMRKLYACMYPSVWGQGLANRDLVEAQNLVHELGHVLGLRHRGNGETTLAPKSDDHVNTLDTDGNQVGHPWHENIMCYGRARSLDIDLLQVPVIRRHPAVQP